MATPTMTEFMADWTIKVVKARYDFKDGGDDTLSFSKGDIVSVTQIVDGGWWEGMCKGQVGWFPSNFVKDLKKNDGPGNSVEESLKEKEKQQYYEQVVQSLLESELKYEQELKTLLTSYLRPLETANIVSATEHEQLCGNIEELLTFQKSLLVALKDTAKLEGRQKRIGACFMRAATQYRSIYSLYCCNHPKAVIVLTQHNDVLGKFMQTRGASSPAVMALTVGLSNPFRRLDDFMNTFKELERHIPPSHPDKIDIQTSVSVYKDIKSHCLRIRKLKEAELEIMRGTIQEWEGEAISTYGKVIKFINAAMMVDTIKKERFCLLFPSCLVVLSATPDMNGYIYQYKIPLSAIRTNRLPDTNPKFVAFDLSGPPAQEKQTIVCASLMDREELLDAIEELQCRDKPPVSPGMATCLPLVPVLVPAPLSPTAPLHQGKSNSLNRKDRVSSSSSPTRLKEPPLPAATFHRLKMKTIGCLRPGPPVSPITVWAFKEGQAKSPKSKRRMLQPGRRKTEKNKTLPLDSSFKTVDAQALEEDSQILKVIESYCTSTRNRNTINSGV